MSGASYLSGPLSSAVHTPHSSGRRRSSERLRLRTFDGRILPAPTDRWLGVPTDEEDDLLARAVPTVLDVGCGPGRHVAALREGGIPAVGLELDERLVRMARSRGVDVLQGSIFAPLAEEGPWGSALLLDGNIGLGADPVRLVNRVASLVEPGGSILAELSPPATRCEEVMVRIEDDGTAGPWFALGVVGVDALDELVRRAGVDVVDCWGSGQRWFAELRVRGRLVKAEPCGEGRTGKEMLM
jgi:SAM-dependent methyltransferase